MRVRRQASARLQLPAEILQLLGGQTTLEERACVDAGRGMPLEIDDVGLAVLALAAEEVIEPHFVQRGGGGVGGDVSANPVRQAVRAHHHGHRVPADQALDPAFDLLAPGQRRLVLRAQGVDVGGDRRERQSETRRAGMLSQGVQQAVDASPVSLLNHVIQRVEPFPCFDRLDLGGVSRSDVPHSVSVRILIVSSVALQSPILQRRRGVRLEPDRTMSECHVTQACHRRFSRHRRRLSCRSAVAVGDEPRHWRRHSGRHTRAGSRSAPPFHL